MAGSHSSVGEGGGSKGERGGVKKRGKGEKGEINEETRVQYFLVYIHPRRRVITSLLSLFLSPFSPRAIPSIFYMCIYLFYHFLYFCIFFYSAATAYGSYGIAPDNLSYPPITSLTPLPPSTPFIYTCYSCFIALYRSGTDCR
jgi:hypothetical protein